MLRSSFKLSFLMVSGFILSSCVPTGSGDDEPSDAQRNVTTGKIIELYDDNKNGTVDKKQVTEFNSRSEILSQVVYQSPNLAEPFEAAQYRYSTYDGQSVTEKRVTSANGKVVVKRKFKSKTGLNETTTWHDEDLDYQQSEGDLIGVDRIADKAFSMFEFRLVFDKSTPPKLIRKKVFYTELIEDKSTNTFISKMSFSGSDVPEILIKSYVDDQGKIIKDEKLNPKNTTEVLDVTKYFYNSDDKLYRIEERNASDEIKKVKGALFDDQGRVVEHYVDEGNDGTKNTRVLKEYNENGKLKKWTRIHKGSTQHRYFRFNRHRQEMDVDDNADGIIDSRYTVISEGTIKRDITHAYSNDRNWLIL